MCANGLEFLLEDGHENAFENHIPLIRIKQCQMKNVHMTLMVISFTSFQKMFYEEMYLGLD
jgi:hypothetical protein